MIAMVGFVDALMLTVEVLIGLVLAVLGWVGRRVVNDLEDQIEENETEVERNTRFRRTLAGDDEFNGSGRLEEIDSYQDRAASDRRDIRHWQRFLAYRVEALVDVVEDSMDADVDDPGIDPPDDYPRRSD